MSVCSREENVNLEGSKVDLSFLAQKFSLFEGWKI